MIDIIQANEDVFQYLEGTHLTFTFRKSNSQGRLGQGHWFYGNETYLALSFWTGMDWKNRTPNITFTITYNGNIFLEVNVSDSDRKREFVINYLKEKLELGTDGRRFRKYYADNCDIDRAIDELDKFIEGDKKIIDDIIKENINYFVDKNDIIGFIDRKDFKSWRDKIYQYRSADTQDDNEQIHNKPYKINFFEVHNYGPIKYLKIDEIPEFCQWIFVTGQNGSGKTSLLKAISTSLGYRSVKKNVSDFVVNTKLYSEYGNIKADQRQGNEGIRNRRPKVAGLCMYGPFRLMNSSSMTDDDFTALYSKNGSFASLFQDNAPLLDLNRQLRIWKKDSKHRSFLEKRQYFITDILTSIVPNLYSIDYRLESSDSGQVRYRTRKNDFDDELNIEWSDLSSGTKSVFALIVDILLRLYDQQPKILDPAEFKGIVLIDEIDLHLHPLAQKKLIIDLSNVFREVQFIVTTHSPIPLLGAPANSRIYVMTNDDDGINIERMDDKVMFRKILPNAIFSSPIFGLEDLIPQSKSKDEKLYLEDSYDEVQYLEKLNRDIRSFLTNEKQEELMKAFNVKR